MNKQMQDEQIFSDIERLANILPAPIYWLNTKNVVLGANDLAFKLVGGSDIRSDIIGKEHHDFYPKEVADILVENNEKVIQLGQTVEFEETIVDITTGLTKYLMSIRSPLRDDNGKVIGIIGTSIDITDRKEKERLELENLIHKTAAEEHRQFRKVVDQVVHDIRSPIATMQMVLPSCDILPENTRITLNKSAARIQDIANNLLSKFKHEDDQIFDSGKRTFSLIYDAILEIITEKKYEYSQLPVNFISYISQRAYFAFINVDIKEFKRMMSNLINNAVDAFDGKDGKVMISLDVIEDCKVQIIVEDNGKGITKPIKEKILNNIAITSGKARGHGIGFAQIRSALSNNDGSLEIESEVGKGTRMTLTFPKVEMPNWICNSIEVNNGDLVVIVDDDPSIHGAWETRFEKLSTNIILKHFEHGIDAIEFIHSLSVREKDQLLLLTDYELLRQGLHGLDIVKRTQVKRSILVTSHHNNDVVRDLAKLTNTKILPKPLASEVPIIVSSNIPSENVVLANQKLISVDLVVIDDDKILINNLMLYLLNGYKVDTYFTPQDFFDKMLHYTKDTKMLVDYEFKGCEITGLDILKKLHDSGFTDLYLYSGRNFSYNELPKYVNIIMKTNISAIKQLLSL